MHTVYVPADRYTWDTAARRGAEALAALDAHAPDLAAVWGVPDELAGTLAERVRQKLGTEPIEDLRIDLEDGYGIRPDAEEDAEAERATVELAASVAAGTAPPFTGIRFRSFEAPTRRRGIRTLVGVVGTLVKAGGIPDGFVLTLPKVTAVEQVGALVRVLEALEAEHGIAPIRFEIQVETPQSVLGVDGASPCPG